MDCCFLEAPDDTRALDAELGRAVVVTICEPRSVVDLADAAAAIHAEFDVGCKDMSIRPFFREDFLVLCRDVDTRNRLVRGGRASTGQFTLSLRPWTRQARSTAITTPFIVPLALRSVPPNAWTRRAAETLLWGLGLVVRVADRTTRRDDMSAFRVWLRTDDPTQILPSRILVVEEPDRHAVRMEDALPDALWYPMVIVQEAPARLGDAPPPRDSPPPSEDEDSDR